MRSRTRFIVRSPNLHLPNAGAREKLAAAALSAGLPVGRRAYVYDVAAGEGKRMEGNLGGNTGVPRYRFT